MDTQEQGQGLKDLQSRYPKYDVVALQQRLQTSGLVDISKYPAVQAGIMGRFCQIAMKAIGAESFRASFHKDQPAPDLTTLLENVLTGREDAVGTNNTDVPRAELEIGAFRYDSPDTAQYFRDHGVPIPQEVTNIQEWASAIAVDTEVQANADTGLYSKSFRTESGDLRGVPTSIPGIQLEIDGATNGPGRPYLRFDRGIIINGVTALLRQSPDKPLQVGNIISTQFAQRA